MVVLARTRRGRALRIIQTLARKPSKPQAAVEPDVAARFRHVRDAHRDETAQDYVEAISLRVEQQGECRVVDLARQMGVSHVTVSKILTRLRREGLVELDSYRPLRLTLAGKQLAAQIRARHETVLRFLIALGVPARQAEIDAEGIEHHVGEATMRAMKRFLGGA